MWQRLFAISYNTFIETIRQPIYGVILLLTTLLLILNVSLAGFTFDDDDKLLLDLGLSTLLLSGLFLSAFSATEILNREIENKTVLSVISKPISRPLFILGKILGLQAALTLAFYINLLVFMLCQRHGVMSNTTDPWDLPVIGFGAGSLILAFIAGVFCNFFYGKHFATASLAFYAPLLTIGTIAVTLLDEKFQPIPFMSDFVGGQVIMAAFLVYLAISLVAAFALAASTRFGPVMTLLSCSAFMMVGIISDWAFNEHPETYVSYLATGVAVGIAAAVSSRIGPVITLCLCLAYVIAGILGRYMMGYEVPTAVVVMVTALTGSVALVSATRYGVFAGILIAKAYLLIAGTAVSFLPATAGDVYVLYLTTAASIFVGLAVAVRFGAAIAIACGVFVPLLGFGASLLLGQPRTIDGLASILYGVLPNIGPFWVIDGLYAESAATSIPFIYIGYVTAYALLIFIAITCVAMAMFQRREVG